MCNKKYVQRPRCATDARNAENATKAILVMIRIPTMNYLCCWREINTGRVSLLLLLFHMREQSQCCSYTVLSYSAYTVTQNLFY